MPEGRAMYVFESPEGAFVCVLPFKADVSGQLVTTGTSRRGCAASPCTAAESRRTWATSFSARISYETHTDIITSQQ